MKPLFVLFIASVGGLIFTRLYKGRWKFRLAARLGMSVMLLFTAMGHFLFPKGMSLMLPDFIPFKYLFVYLTAGLEIMGAIGIQLPKWRVLSAWLLILFFILVLPANIHAALEELNYQTATYNGPGINYLWFRIPLQLLFIFWTYFSSVQRS
jgi:uncharacterized membrane protein